MEPVGIESCQTHTRGVGYTKPRKRPRRKSKQPADDTGDDNIRAKVSRTAAGTDVFSFLNRQLKRRSNEGEDASNIAGGSAATPSETATSPSADKRVLQKRIGQAMAGKEALERGIAKLNDSLQRHHKNPELQKVIPERALLGSRSAAQVIRQQLQGLNGQLEQVQAAQTQLVGKLRSGEEKKKGFKF